MLIPTTRDDGGFINGIFWHELSLVQFDITFLFFVGNSILLIICLAVHLKKYWGIFCWTRRYLITYEQTIPTNPTNPHILLQFLPLISTGVLFIKFISVKPLWHIMIATSVIMYSQNYIFNKGE